MNINDAIELLDDVSNFHFKASEKRPSISIYDNQKDGYWLCIKASLVNEGYRSHLEEIVNSRKLGMRESNGYLIIYSY